MAYAGIAFLLFLGRLYSAAFRLLGLEFHSNEKTELSEFVVRSVTEGLSVRA